MSDQDWENPEKEPQPKRFTPKKALQVKRNLYGIGALILLIIACIHFFFPRSQAYQATGASCDFSKLVPTLFELDTLSPTNPTDWFKTKRTILGSIYGTMSNATIDLEFYLDHLDQSLDQSEEATVLGCFIPTERIKINSELISITDEAKMTEYFNLLFADPSLASNPQNGFFTATVSQKAPRFTQSFVVSEEGDYTLFVSVESAKPLDKTTLSVIKSSVTLPASASSNAEDWGTDNNKPMVDSNTTVHQLYGPFKLSAVGKSVETKVQIDFDLPQSQMRPTGNEYSGAEALRSMVVSGSFINEDHLVELATNKNKLNWTNDTQIIHPNSNKLDISNCLLVNNFLNYLEEYPNPEFSSFEEYSFQFDDIYKYQYYDTLEQEQEQNTLVSNNFVLEKEGNYFLILETELPRNRFFVPQIKSVNITEGAGFGWFYLLGFFILLTSFFIVSSQLTSLKRKEMRS